MLTFELRNFPLMKDIQAFDGRIKLYRIEEAQERLHKNHRVGLRITTATLCIDKNLPTALDTNEQSLVFHLCELLCFASRRGVTIAWPRHWGKRRDLIVRGGISSRGPIESPRDIELLLDKGLSKLVSDDFENETKCGKGLRTFLGWQLEQYLDMKFVRLWMAFEMLARAHCRKIYPSRDMTDLQLVQQFIKDLQLPGYDTMPIKDMYIVRGHIIHGNEELTNQVMRRFMHLAQKRHRELFEADLMFNGLARKITQHFPTDEKRAKLAKREFEYIPMVPDYGSALLEPVLYLSRILEKVFLVLFDTKESWYFQKAEYFTVWSP